MSGSKKIDGSVIYYVLGGAAIGAIAGYIIKKVGMKNVVNLLKTKNIIPENVVDSISEFVSRTKESDLEDD